MSVLDDLLGKKPQTVRVDVCLDPELGDELTTARRAMQKAQSDSEKSPNDTTLGAAAAEAETAYDDALAKVKAHIVTITFQAIDPAELDALKGEHRPTDQQKRDAARLKEAVPEWNVDTFPPVLMAAACLLLSGPSGTEVGMSLEAAQQLWKAPGYNEAERAEIWNMCVAAQRKVSRLGDIPKG